MITRINILLFLMLIFGCSESKNHKTIKVHTYKTKSENDDSWIYWYLIYSENSNCYSYSSPTPISNFSKINFGSVGPKPQVLESEKEYEEIEIDDENLPSEVEGVETSESESSGESSSESSSGGDDGGSSGGDGGDGGGSGD